MNYKTLKALNSRFLKIQEQLDSINTYLSYISSAQYCIGQPVNLSDFSWKICNIESNIALDIPRDIAETLVARSKSLLEIELKDIKHRLNITD